MMICQAFFKKSGLNLHRQTQQNEPWSLVVLYLHQTVSTMRSLLLLFFCVLLATSVNAQRYVGGRYSRVRLSPPTRYRQYHPGRSSQQQGVVAPDSTRRQPASGKLGKQEAARVNKKAAKRTND